MILKHSVPEGEEGLLGESGASGGHGQDEGDDAEGRVDGDEVGPEGGRGGFAAKQEQEAEEADHELKREMVKNTKKPLHCFKFYLQSKQSHCDEPHP